MSYLKKYDISSEHLIGNCPLPKLGCGDLSVGLVLDLYNFALTNGVLIKNNLCRWLSCLTGEPLNQLNEKALVSKIHRILKSLRTRRLTGASKDTYLSERFICPSHSPSAPRSNEGDTSGLTVLEKTNEKLEDKLQERRKTVVQVRESAKQLKRKLERTEKRLDQKKKKLETVEVDFHKKMSDFKKNEKETKFLKSSLAKTKLSAIKLKASLISSSARGHQQSLSLKVKDNEIKKLKAEVSKNAEVVEKAKQAEKELKNANESIDYLQSLLEDNAELKIFDSESQTYSNETVECVMNLTDLKVPSEKVGEVIKTVSSFCGRSVNRVPAPSTVNRIVDSKVAIAQKQIASQLKDKTDTTMYTDETRKYGKCLQSYIITDDESNSYILGLREMVDKSGQSTLDTLKEIIEDISTYCHEKEVQNEMGVGYKILANIRDTMSDRASTEKHFNTLLEQYRSEILPQVVLGWADLTEEERSGMARMNNFFCGLHLLVGMADVCESTLKKFENNYLDGKDIGSAAIPELKRFHRNESGTLRLLRTSSKVFAVGEDEKNGVSLPWLTYLKTKHEKNHIVRFKHNRFNLVFSLSQAVFYHRSRVSEFLDTVHGTDNGLLKAVSLDIKETLHLAGLKAFGLISKLITGPLWQSLEESGHILEMNVKYKLLVDFLQKGANDVEAISKFSTGEDSPFQTVLGDDAATQSLLENNEELTEILLPMLQSLFLSMHQLLGRMVVDHLPGGKYSEPSDELISETRSAMRHNKLPEFVFGQLDQLLRYRPNATLLTNEAYLMYSHNKTRKWLADLPKDEKEKLIEESRKEGKVIRRQFKVRLSEIEAKRLDIQNQRRRQMEERERKRLKNLETFTADVCFYGLWQSAQQIEEGLENLNTETEKRNALQSQLRFRKNVLKQKHDDKHVYNFSRKNEQGKYIKLSIEQLQNNVLSLIQETLSEPTVERATTTVPLLVGKDIDHTFADGQTYRGTVISMVPGFNEWYNVKYVQDNAIYAYNLKVDYMAGDVKLVVQDSAKN